VCVCVCGHSGGRRSRTQCVCGEGGGGERVEEDGWSCKWKCKIGGRGKNQERKLKKGEERRGKEMTGQTRRGRRISFMFVNSDFIPRIVFERVGSRVSVNVFVICD